MTGLKIYGILSDEEKWAEANGINLALEIAKSHCQNTKVEWNGDFGSVTIACLHKPARVIWWYRGSKCYYKPKKSIYALLSESR